MKRDEDVWISRGTKASRPDEFWPDQGSGMADRALQASKTEKEEGGEQSANPDTPGPALLAVQMEMETCTAPSPSHPPLPPPSSSAPRSATQIPHDWKQHWGRRHSESRLEMKNFSIQR